jgi:MYXO-CTERM domain-containing protein
LFWCPISGHAADARYPVVIAPLWVEQLEARRQLGVDAAMPARSKKGWRGGGCAVGANPESVGDSWVLSLLSLALLRRRRTHIR